MEADAGFTTLVVTTKDDFNFDIDEIPIAKLDFSNVSMNAAKETPNAAKSKSAGKGKTAMSYEYELEEREKKLQSAEKILHCREHAVDIRQNYKEVGG